MIFAGIDIGSITAKAALVRREEDGRLTLMGTIVRPTGYNHAKAARSVFEAILAQTRTEEAMVAGTVATGYGRNAVPFAGKTLTEIICHGAGAHFTHPGIRGVIDVGGQDSKAIYLTPGGRVDNFAMNDKCAAGTGRFLEVMARALELSLEELSSRTSDTPARISSICTVFAESEVISMIAAQKPRADIVAGIHDSAAARVAGLASQIRLSPPVAMTGGVAKNMGFIRALEHRLGYEVTIGALAQENGAVGAAVLASKEG